LAEHRREARDDGLIPSRRAPSSLVGGGWSVAGAERLVAVRGAARRWVLLTVDTRDRRAAHERRITARCRRGCRRGGRITARAERLVAVFRPAHRRIFLAVDARDRRAAHERCIALLRALELVLARARCLARRLAA